jgi:hypothetical protein
MPLGIARAGDSIHGCTFRIARAGDADPGSLERRRREKALPIDNTLSAREELDGCPMLPLPLVIDLKVKASQ